VTEVERQVHVLQQKADFTSDYDSWIARSLHPILELSNRSLVIGSLNLVNCHKSLIFR